MKSIAQKNKEARITRHKRIRAKVRGTLERPRLAVYRSNKFINAQLINDDAGTTLASAEGKAFGGSMQEQAVKVGNAIAEKALAQNITTAVFDRGGFFFGGTVKTLADTARNKGLIF